MIFSARNTRDSQRKNADGEEKFDNIAIRLRFSVGKTRNLWLSLETMYLSLVSLFTCVFSRMN